MTGESPELTGGCLCGEIRYRARRPVSAPALCHCVSCRQASGAPVVAWFTVRTGDLELVGAPATEFRSSEHVIRSFCGRCGTPLSYRHDRYPDYVDITLASLDDPSVLPPGDHVWTSHRIPWMEDLRGLPEHEKSRGG